MKATIELNEAEAKELVEEALRARGVDIEADSVNFVVGYVYSGFGPGEQSAPGFKKIEARINVE